MAQVLIDRLSIPCLEDMSEHRDLLVRALSSNQIADSLLSKITTCFTEHVTNVFENNNLDKLQIEYSLIKEDKELILTIYDDGHVFNPCSSESELDIFSLDDESGRGLPILKAWTDDIHYVEGKNNFANTLVLHWLFESAKSQHTIYLIDDDESLRALYEAYLSEDYKLVSFACAEEALAQIDSSCDLIISDISMPLMNGVEFRKKLLESNLGLIPFIYLTGQQNAALCEDVIELGVDDFIVKPVNKENLKTVIDRVLYRSQHIKNVVSEKIGSKITKALYPALPSELPDWRISFDTRSAGFGGGDLILLEQGDLSLIILVDVMGHDESAKFFAHAIAGYIRGVLRSYKNHESPELVLNAISNAIYTDDLLEHSGMTIVLAALFPNGRVSLASAGHPYPYQLSSEACKRLEVSGMIPGLLPSQTYKQININVHKDERLVLYSDGLIDSLNAGDGSGEGENQLKQLLQESANLPIEGIATSLLDQCQNRSSKFMDDVTLLILQPKF